MPELSFTTERYCAFTNTAGIRHYFPYCAHKIAIWEQREPEEMAYYEKQYFYHILYVDNCPAGIAIVTPYITPHSVYTFVCLLEVRKQYRGKEYGMLLVDYLYKQWGGYPVMLCAANNKRAYKYYLPRGFKFEGNPHKMELVKFC